MSAITAPFNDERIRLWTSSAFAALLAHLAAAWWDNVGRRRSAGTASCPVINIDYAERMPQAAASRVARIKSIDLVNVSGHGASYESGERPRSEDRAVAARAESRTRDWRRSTFRRRSETPERSQSSLRSRMISSSLFHGHGLAKTDGTAGATLRGQGSYLHRSLSRPSFPAES